MASYLFYASQSGAGYQAELTGYRDGAYVMKGVGIGSTNSTAIHGDFGYHVVTVEGIVTGDATAIDLGNSLTEDHDQRVTIGSDGEVFGYGSQAILVWGYKSSVVNSGFIYGDSTAVEMHGENSVTTSKLTNRGTIVTNGSFAVIHSGEEKFALTNSGTIESAGYSVYCPGAETATVTNTGKLIGDVYVGDGGGVYDGRGGNVVGQVFGGAGADKLYGGTEKNTLNGSVGEDRLYGGAGSDRLTGGSDNDRFYFDTALKSGGIDTITDFNTESDLDRIYLAKSVFAALGASVTSGEFIAVATGHAAKDSTDRLIYNTKDGSLWYDADGSGKGAAVHFSTLSNKALLGYDDFVMA
jgi:Ca2+-binding RTX toxin-like protein